MQDFSKNTKKRIKSKKVKLRKVNGCNYRLLSAGFLWVMMLNTIVMLVASQTSDSSISLSTMCPISLMSEVEHQNPRYFPHSLDKRRSKMSVQNLKQEIPLNNKISTQMNFLEKIQWLIQSMHYASDTCVNTTVKHNQDTSFVYLRIWGYRSLHSLYRLLHLNQ